MFISFLFYYGHQQFFAFFGRMGLMHGRSMVHLILSMHLLRCPGAIGIGSLGLCYRNADAHMRDGDSWMAKRFSQEHNGLL